MRISQKHWPLLTALIMIVLLAYGLSQDPKKLPSPLLAKPMPHFKLPDLWQNKLIDSQTTWSHHLTILNIWASWCTPCRAEHEFLIELKARYPAIHFIGINYKDDLLRAQSFLKALGDPYDTVLADVAGSTAIDLGVYGVPETFLIDDRGMILQRYAGRLTETAWKKEFEPLLK